MQKVWPVHVLFETWEVRRQAHPQPGFFAPWLGRLCPLDNQSGQSEPLHSHRRGGHCARGRPVTAQDSPCGLMCFDQEIGALVSLATKGKPAVSPGKDSPMPPVPSPPPIDNGETGAQAAVENGEAGAQAAIQNGEADAEVEQGEDTRVDSPSPPVDSPEPEAARKRSADGPEGSPAPKRAKHTDTHGQSDDGEITLGEDSSFKFMLVGGHIFGQSLKSKRRIPGGTFVWASEDGKLEERPDSPDLKDNPLLWSPTSRTKVWMLQDAEDPPKFVSVGELLKNHNLTQIVGKGPVTSKNISRKSCNLVWETKDKTTRAVLSAMSSKLEVSFVL